MGRFEYGAWGEEVFASVSPALAGFAYRFVGGLGVRTDSVTGLVYMRNRWYDPGLMRFVSRDQILSKNAYRYARNNPTRFIDANGLAWTPGPDGGFSQEQVNRLRSELMARTSSKECKEAIDKLKTCRADSSVPDSNVWDFIYNKANIQWFLRPEMRGNQDAGTMKRPISPEEGYGWMIDTSYDIPKDPSELLTEEMLEVSFHELLHVVGAEHLYGNDKAWFDEVLLSVVARKCGFTQGFSNLGNAGRYLHDSLLGTGPGPNSVANSNAKDNFFSRLKFIRGGEPAIRAEMKNSVNQLFPGYFP